LNHSAESDRSSLSLHLLALAVMALPDSAAWAQSSPATEDTDSASKLEQVVVTVQRRKEKLQDVPVAATAISQADLESRNLSNLADFSAIAPNLQVSFAPGDSTAAQVSMRGSVTNNPALYWEPTVGMYVDGVYVGKAQGSVFDLLDLERVEVLRGPQGTLYGRNTLAGAVNLVTQAPSGEFSGQASLEFGNYNARVEKLSMDLPSMGGLKIAVGARAENRDGWIRTTPGSSVPDLNNKANQSGRIAASLDLTRDLTLDYRFDITHVNQNGSFSQIVRSNVKQDFGIPGIVVSPSGRQTLASVNDPQFERMEQNGNSLTATWRLDESNTLKYIISRRNMTWQDALDLDGSPISFAHTERLSTYTQNSNELQLQGSHGPLSYVLGAYRFTDEGYTANPQSYFLGAYVYDSQYGFTTSSKSVFTQLDYKLNDHITLTGGFRHNSDDKAGTHFLALNAMGSGFASLVPAGTSAQAKFNSDTPMVSVSYKLNDQVSTYAKYSEGFKGGGFNGEASTTVEATTPYKPEKVKAYELGLKSTFDKGRAQLNAALFENKTQNMQVSVFTATGAASSDIRNVGSSTTQGLELEGIWKPASDLRLQASYGYLHVKYDTYLNDQGQNVADNIAVAHAPTSTLNLLVDKRFGRNTMGVLRGLMDYSYTSSFYLYPYQLVLTNPQAALAENTKIKPVGYLNLRMMLSDIRLSSQSSGEVSLWVKNALDTAHIGNMIDFGPGFGNLTSAYYDDPRTFGISFTARW